MLWQKMKARHACLTTTDRSGKLSNLFLILGGTIIVFVFSLFLLASIGFAFGLIISKAPFYGAIMLAAIFLALNLGLHFEKILRSTAISLVAMGAVFAISLKTSQVFFDLSYDGQSYHQEAAIQLANGWNPYREELTPDVWDHSYAIWLNHFPKFSWVGQATIYKALGKIETGKLINPLLVFATLFFALAALVRNRKISLLTTLALATIIAFNPVNLGQLTTSSIDTHIASFITSLILLLYLIFQSQKTNKLAYFLLSLVIISILNVKFTMLVYVPIIIGAALIYLLITNRKKTAFILSSMALISGFLGVFFFGYHPYITNWQKYDHPFYPMFTARPTDNTKLVPAVPNIVDIRKFIYDSNMPINFIGKSRTEKMFLSFFSQSSNLASHYDPNGQLVNERKTNLKLPFSITRKELEAFNDSDVRIAGFGPLFGGIIIISLAVLAFCFLRRKKETWLAAGIMLVIIASMTTNPEGWWARYVPHVWLIPVVIVILCREIDMKILHWVATTITLMLVANLYLISIGPLQFQYKNSKYRHSYLTSLKAYNTSFSQPIKVEFGEFRANRALYKEYGISYVENRMEVGIMENQLLSKLSPPEAALLNNYYKRNPDEYSYRLDDQIDATALKQVATIFDTIGIELQRDPL